jgi:rRNA maturation RNase YbeY
VTKDRAHHAVRRYFVTHKTRVGRGRAPRVETATNRSANAARSRSTAASKRAGARSKARAAPIAIHWDGVTRFAPDAEVRRAVRAARKLGRREDLWLSVVFVSDARLARLHAQHLGDPARTDVITFDLSDDLGGPGGEIYVSAPCARRTARKRGVVARRELCLYVVHGVLHLCGYDDHERADRARMRVAEARVMRASGWKDDPNPHDA